MVLLSASIFLFCLFAWVQSATIPSLVNASVDDLRSGLAQKRFTSVDLVNAYVARIHEVNPTLRAVTELNPGALAIARALDAERARGDIRGPLHGLPILIKDNIATFDKMNNTAGSFALLGSKVPCDATVVAKLRQAGAILLGKANLSQWASFRGFKDTQGWSAYGGQVTAAYVPNQDPSGSSSGSGVGSSLGLAIAALGTETHGSILLPSDASNVVGIKPSVGLTSRYLVIPISETQDTVGPIAKTVKDAAYVLQAIVGQDPKDNYTASNPNGVNPPDYVGACKTGSLKGRRFGIPRNVFVALAQATYFNDSGPVLAAFNDAVQMIQKQGATIVDANFTGLDQYLKENGGLTNGPEFTVTVSDFVSDLAKYFSELINNPYKLKTLQDLRNFTINNPAEQVTQHNIEIWDKALALGFNRTDARADQARQRDQYLGGDATLLGAISRNKVDAVLLPTRIGYRFAAIVGSPAVTVPLGAFPRGTVVSKDISGRLTGNAPNYPFGIAFMGPKWSEANLISYAYSFEQLTMVRDKIKPYIAPRSEIKPGSS